MAKKSNRGGDNRVDPPRPQPLPRAVAKASEKARQAMAPMLSRAIELHKSGQLDKAKKIYQEIVAADPRQHVAICFLGVIAHQQGESTAALRLLLKSLEIESNNEFAHNNLGVLFMEKGEHKKALHHFLKASEINPKNVETRNNVGAALLKLGRADDALKTYRKVVIDHPSSATAHIGLGGALIKSGRRAEAMQSYQQALRIDPKAIAAKGGVIEALLSNNEHAAARALCEKALGKNSSSAALFRLKGRIEHQMGDAQRAMESYRRALDLDPKDVSSWKELARILYQRHDFIGAISSLEKVLALEPNNPEFLSYYGVALVYVGRLEDAITQFERSIEISPERAGSRANLLYALNHHPEATARKIFMEASALGAVIAKGAAPFAYWKGAKKADRPLNVGLVSADFRRHALAWFLLTSLDEIDRDKVRLFAYCENARSDEITAQLQAIIPDWRTIHGVSDEDAAKQIHADAIDILIDLSGHTTGGRLGVFARKPAPIQVSWLGYSGTTGLSAMDYVFCDSWEIPPEEESYFTEKPWRLPATRHCFAPPREDVAVGPLPAQAAGHVTFGVFQRRAKINSAVRACFAGVLEAAPDSRLAFLGRGFDSAVVREELIAQFERLGVESQRLLFWDRAPTRADVFAYYNRIDIALSPFPWPGITTTCEALWMGVPTVFMRGERFLGRIGECVCNNLDLTEWMADDMDDYAFVAGKHANDLDTLAGLRASLRDKFISSPLCDAARFARNLEEAFEDMWRLHLERRSKPK